MVEHNEPTRGRVIARDDRLVAQLREALTVLHPDGLSHRPPCKAQPQPAAAAALRARSRRRRHIGHHAPCPRGGGVGATPVDVTSEACGARRPIEAERALDGRRHFAHRPRVAEHRAREHTGKRAELRDHEAARVRLVSEQVFEREQVQPLTHRGHEQHFRHPEEREALVEWHCRAALKMDCAREAAVDAAHERPNVRRDARVVLWARVGGDAVEQQPQRLRALPAQAAAAADVRRGRLRRRRCWGRRVL